jgi:hypothetical protein
VAGHDGWALLRHLAAGERRAVRLAQTAGTADRLRALGDRWGSWADLTFATDATPRQTALIVSEVAAPGEQTLRVTPRLPVEESTLRVVVGLLP